MSLQAAAAAMGVPEILVQRSAEARAKATGQSVDDILAAWAGGEAAPAAAPAPTAEPAPAPEPAAAEPAPEPTTAPAAAAPEPAAVAVATAPRVPAEPPVLIGRHERIGSTLFGAAALLALSLFVGVWAASVPQESRGAYTSDVEYSAAALDGQDVYRSHGCASCHTQMVRPVVADATLGGVTVSDSNQVLGWRRYGPDLAHVGSRHETDAGLYAALAGGGGHPSYSGLSQSDLDALVTYLLESA